MNIAIIGGGPAGLMAAEVLSAHGRSVDVYDSMPSLGRKFLMAGRGGLNLTHSEPFENFLAKYGERRQIIEKWLLDFTPEDVRAWASHLGIETFVGTSGRVFPNGMKASPLLRLWLARLEGAGVRLHTRHRWVGWDAVRALRFETPAGEKTVHAEAVILALGGGSWARLGSDGAWTSLLEQAGVQVAALKPSNCGFDVDWSPIFIQKFEGQPVKSVTLSFGDFHQRGEFVVTRTGVEGSLVYAASRFIREAIEAGGPTLIHLDLAPDATEAQLTEKLARPRGKQTVSSHVKKTVGIHGVKMGLLWEFLPKTDVAEPRKLAAAIKRLPVTLTAPRPLDEAISSAGGVTFESLDGNLMLKKIPGVFCAGEMLDWEAPTGGYLITACMASGRAAASGVLQWLKNSEGK